MPKQITTLSYLKLYINFDGWLKYIFFTEFWYQVSQNILFLSIPRRHGIWIAYIMYIDQENNCKSVNFLKTSTLLTFEKKNWYKIMLT